MNRRLFLGGFLPALAWSATPFRLSRPDGLPEAIDPAANTVTALIFLSTLCPISNAYQDRISSLITRFQHRPVRILLVDSNDNESSADTREYAKAAGFPSPIYKDWRNTVADRFRATLTPEAIVLDANGAVKYHGAIDDARNPARVKIEALRIAIDDLLAARPVSVKPIRAFGCVIKKVS